MGRQGRKRLAVDIPIGWHKKLQEIAKDRNETVTKQIWRLIAEFIKKQREYE